MYTGTDHLHRFVVWRDNLERIVEHNAAFKRGEETFWMAVNQFADMTAAEFKAMQGYKSEKKLGASAPAAAHGKACSHRNLVPKESVDWRTMGAVTGVKDQGQCGRCDKPHPIHRCMPDRHCLPTMGSFAEFPR